MAQDALRRDERLDLGTALRSANWLVGVQWANSRVLADALLAAEYLTYATSYAS